MAEPHPSDKRLERWLQGRSTPFTSNHVQHCPQCQQRLEDWTALENELREQLGAELSPSSSLTRKLQDRLQRRFADRETMSVLTDLMSNGLRTTQVLVEGSQNEEDDHVE